jgi:hypothetical protein
MSSHSHPHPYPQSIALESRRGHEGSARPHACTVSTLWAMEHKHIIFPPLHLHCTFRPCSAGQVSAGFSLFQLIPSHRTLFNQPKPAGFYTSRTSLQLDKVEILDRVGCDNMQIKTANTHVTPQIHAPLFHSLMYYFYINLIICTLISLETRAEK